MCVTRMQSRSWWQRISMPLPASSPHAQDLGLRNMCRFFPFFHFIFCTRQTSNPNPFYSCAKQSQRLQGTPIFHTSSTSKTRNTVRNSESLSCRIFSKTSRRQVHDAQYCTYKGERGDAYQHECRLQSTLVAIRSIFPRDCLTRLKKGRRQCTMDDSLHTTIMSILHEERACMRTCVVAIKKQNGNNCKHDRSKILRIMAHPWRMLGLRSEERPTTAHSHALQNELTANSLEWQRRTSEKLATWRFVATGSFFGL